MIRQFFCVLILLCYANVSMAEEPFSRAFADNNTNPDIASYSWDIFTDNADHVKWDAALLFGGITAIGLWSWEWGTSNFNINNEKWFGPDTGSGGADKMGHAFSSYTITNILSERMMYQGVSREQAALSGFLIAQGLMMYVEIFDGFSDDHGFSYEDVVFNTLGGGLAWLRQRYPWVKNRVDYRMEYWPSGYAGSGLQGVRPLSDYSGQRYLLAFKFNESRSFLRFFELQLGYYTRGFSSEEKADGLEPRRVWYSGVGINLAQLFFGSEAPDDGAWHRAGRFFFEHYEVPGTSIQNRKEI